MDGYGRGLDLGSGWFGVIERRYGRDIDGRGGERVQWLRYELEQRCLEDSYGELGYIRRERYVDLQLGYVERRK